MSAFSEEFKDRTKKFAVSMIAFPQLFPKKDEAYIIKKQLLCPAFSVASNYRAVCRARSDAEFFVKLNIAVEEADETVFWLELLKEFQIILNSEVSDILKEANEILAIVAKSRKTLNERSKQQFANSSIL